MVGQRQIDPFNRLLPRDAMLCLSVVRPSVRPSQAGTVPKRLNVRSRKQRYVIAQGLYSFLTPEILVKFQRRHPVQGRYRGIDSNWRFSTNISLYLRNGAR